MLDLVLKSLCGLEVVKEYRFHPVRRWRFDYYLPKLKVAIEVEGGAFSKGRHTRGKGFIADMEKYNQALMMGIRVIRVTPQQVMSTYLTDMIRTLNFQADAA